MKNLLVVIATLLFTQTLIAQKNTPKDFGFRHIQYPYKKDTVNILIQSKKGEEDIKKPIFLFIQGSLPIPLIIKYDENNIYTVFPFKTDSLIEKYHLVIIGKPGIPVIEHVKNLNLDFTYLEKQTGKIPGNYSQHNFYDYYVQRNNVVLKFLHQLPWVSSNQLVISGHSEGASIAAKIANENQGVTHLIYSSGNPFGRIMSMIAQNRGKNRETENTFEYWAYILDNKESLDTSNGDTPKATYDASFPPIQHIEKLKIPILVCYGTKDYSVLFNDYMRVCFMREYRTNTTFKSYEGLEHNYFGLKESGEVNYDDFNWDKVANDWINWLKINP